MGAMFTVGLVGLLFITVAYGMLHETSYTICERDRYRKYNENLKFYYKLIAITWFMLWLFPPLLKIWITTVLGWI